ncbi:MAG: leucine-rich repeat domain-containing protein [Opitutaceae bacterium]|jgi:hypothetical protein
MIAKKGLFGAWLGFVVLCCMASALSAATFGDFTYTDDGTSITITGFPTSVVGDVAIPATINGEPVTSIGDQAFYNCYGLTNVAIPSSVTSIGISAFYGCSGLASISVDTANPSYSSSDGVLLDKLQTTVIKCPAGKSGAYTIPSSVTSIGNSAFYRCSGLTSVTIPVGVTSISDSAFYFCSSLTSATIPSSVTSIGTEAFVYCTKLTRVTIPSGVTSIGSGAFSHCSGLTSMTISSGVTSIGYAAFYYCSGLTSITIPSSVTSIGYYAFSYCSGLTSVMIPSSVTSLGIYAFSNCSKLTSVTIPSSVPSIGSYAFSQCSGLTSVTISSGVASIGRSAFSECSGLTSVTIPSSVTSIGNYAFLHCSVLVSISVDAANLNYSSSGGVLFDKLQTTLIQYPGGKSGAYAIPPGVTSIGISAFDGCRVLTSVTIPSSVTSIGSSAFTYCRGLTSVTISSGVTSIADYAFYYCSGLTSVTIPSSVTSIGGNAFQGCTKLTSVSFMGNAPALGYNAFYDVASGFTVYYLNGSSGFTSPTWQGYPSQGTQGTQTITFGALSGKTYGNAPFTLSATASSGLTPTFSIVSGPATISGSTVTLTGVGTVVVRAAQAGDANYTAATPVDQSFIVAQAAQTISFTKPADLYFGTSGPVLAATASSGLEVSFMVSAGNASISGGILSLSSPGNVTVVASQGGNGNYLPAPPVSQTFTVLPSFYSWRQDKNLPPGKNGPNDDAGGNGILNLVAYGLAFDPMVSPPPASGLTPGTPALSMNGTNIRLEFVKDSNRSDIEVITEVSSDLVTWTPVTYEVVESSGSLQHCRSEQPLGANSRKFMRVKIRQLTPDP